MNTNETYTDELEQMRRDMSELRSLLGEQQIVNERLMRRAMNADMGKEKRDIIRTIVIAVAAIPVYLYFLPQFGLPLWFAIATAAFFATCCMASAWSLYRLCGESIVTGNLVAVAERIAAYKRFGNRWLCIAIPVVIVWLATFVRYSYAAMDNADMREGFVYGCVTGLVVGGGVGAMHLLKSRRRLNGILRQIEEMKNVDKA